jgi:hypothetical protein
VLTVGLTGTVVPAPLHGTVPMFVPLSWVRVQVVASVVAQVSVDEPPMSIEVGLAVNEVIPAVQVLDPRSHAPDAQSPLVAQPQVPAARQSVPALFEAQHIAPAAPQALEPAAAQVVPLQQTPLHADAAEQVVVHWPPALQAYPLGQSASVVQPQPPDPSQTPVHPALVVPAAG